MADEQSTSHYSRTTVGALAVGLLSLPAAFLPFGIIIALAGLVLGVIARREALANGRPHKMAHAAIVMAAIALAIWIVVVTGFAMFAWLSDG